MSTVFEPDPNNNNSLSLQTSYVYTVLDQKTTVTQGSQTRTSNYDGMGRLTGETTPEAGTVSYQYNSFNKMTQRTDARGVVTTYTYDTLNRLTGISYNVTNTTATATSSVSYTYGTNAAQYNNGRLVTVTDGPGSVTYTYDLLGRVTQEQQIINGNSYTIGYQYNLAGQVTSLTYPSGRVVQPSYDTIGRLTSVSTGTTTLASGVTYDPSFRVTTYTYGNGIVANLSYSSDRRQLQSMSYVSGSQTLFGESAYGHSQNGGNNGQITSITDSVDSGRNITYAYDALGRLSSAVTAGSTNYPKWGLSWTYDRYGNRMTQAVTAGTAPSNSVTVNAATNQITTSGYSYDASGNMTNDGVNAMTYDAEGRVATAADGAGTATYSYRASGLRVLKSFGSTTTVYVYVGNRALAEYANGSLSKEYTYLNNRLLASYVNGTLYYHHFDLLSTRITTDTSGNNVGGQGHYPYGEDWYETGTTTTRHFTTYERDSESANDYAIHRVYVNRLGRFSSADSVRPCGKNPQLFDRFAYVADDPVNRTDPTGLYFYVCPQGEEDPGLDCSYCNTQSTGFYDLSGGEDAICASSGGEPGGGGGGLSCAPNIIAPRNEQFHCNTQQRSTVTISGRDVLNINIFNLHVQATTDNLILLELIGTPYLSSLSNPDNIIYEQVFNVHKTEYSSGNLNWTVEYECDGPFFTVNRTTVIKSSPNSCK
jgi:RHS repeat-associated protein